MDNVVNDTQAEVVVQQQEGNPESVNAEVATAQGQEAIAEKVTQSPEENSKFAEMRRKHEAELAKVRAEVAKSAKDTIAKELFADKGVESYDDLKSVLSQEKQAKEVQKLVDEGYTEEQAKRIVQAENGMAEVNEYKKQQESESQQVERTKQENEDFLKYFKESNGRDFTKDDVIDQAVWDKVKDGTPLKVAYMEHELAQFRTGQQTNEQNQTAAEGATGSIEGIGEAPKRDLTEEDIEKMSPKELSRRWPEVKKLFGMR